MKRVLVIAAVALAACAKTQTLNKASTGDVATNESSTREYDWSRAILLSEVPLRRFKPATIKVTGLNPLCYDYKREFQTKVVDPPNFDGLKALAGIETASKKKEPAAAPGSMAALRDSLNALADSLNPFLPAGGRDGKLARNQLPALADTLDAELALARDAIAAANHALAAADNRITAVGQAAKKISETACVAATPFAKTLSSWQAAQRESAAMMNEAVEHLTSAEAKLDEARDHLRKSEGLKGRLQRNELYVKQSADRTSYGAALNRQADNVKGDLEDAEESYHETDARILAVRSASQEADATIRAIEHVATLQFAVQPGLADAAYEISLIATPKTVKEGSNAKAETQKFVVNVSNSLRVLVSAGFAFAPIEAPLHARTNRPWILPDSAGKTYSTYDITDREELAYAPMLSVNGMFGRIGPVPFGVAFGAAVREVRSKKGIDFLLGPSFSLQDHVFFTIGYYNSRREYLRLGEVKTVSQSPVATSISDADAIGVERGGSIGFSVSFKN